MANRPYFGLGDTTTCFYTEQTADFVYSPGLARSQKVKNVHALHESILRRHPQSRTLEISTKSDLQLGQALSAFNLTWQLNGKAYPLECIFQGSKVFSQGGPYKDLILGEPLQAKRDERLKNSGSLQHFIFRSEKWPLEPATCFYDYIYMQALRTHPDLVKELVQFDTFTDIEFNPKRSVNCQARSVAIFVTLVRYGRLDEFLCDQESFIKLYRNRVSDQQELLAFA